MLLTPMQSAPDFLTQIFENETSVMLGVLFILIMGICVAGIAIWIYPVLRKHGEGAALGYTAARVVEGVLDIVLVIVLLILVTLSKSFVTAGSPSNSYFISIGELLLKIQTQWVGPLLLAIVFCISALLLYPLLFKSRLVPR